MFALHGIEHRYDGRVALAVPSWQASRGERWLLAGPSGSGKSTLLGVLAGLLRPTAGKVTVGDHDLSQWSGRRDHALLLTLYDTGGKGRKERSVPLWPTTAGTLQNWFHELNSSNRRCPEDC